MRTARASGAPPDDRRPPWPRPRNSKYEVANAQYGGVPEREGRFVQFSLYRPSMAAYYGQATVPKTRFEFLDLDDDGQVEFEQHAESRDSRIAWIHRLMKRPPRQLL